jgi:HPt (histidine-containing phosphotransfer) domain-containing protein
LGQDLQAGNLASAQTDLTALQKDLPGAQGATPSATSGVTSGANSGTAQSDRRTAQQGLQQLSHDLQAGNLAAAQSDFTNLRQAVQSGNGSGAHSHHHARHGDESSASSNSISQVLSQLGQSLQSDNLSAAQQSYTTLLQEFQQSGAGNCIGRRDRARLGSGELYRLASACLGLKFYPIGPMSISRGVSGR